MDLALTDEQSELVNVFQSLFDKAKTIDRVRTVGAEGFDQQLWTAMCEIGAPEIAICVEHGGAGAGLTEAALLCEQSGRSLAPVPCIDTSVAARLLSATGRQDLLRDVLSGDTVATLSLSPAVEGIWRHVPSGSIAGLVLGMAGGDLIAVTDRELPEPTPNLADLPMCDRHVGHGSTDVLATGEEAQRLFAHAKDEWYVLAAASLTGLADSALAIAVSYVNERSQFGRPLGSFQSIAHHLADCRAALDGSRLLYHQAAWALDSGAEDATLSAAMAFFFASQTAESSAGWSLHFHGGYGFMLEYDIQLLYRRAKAWSLIGGGRGLAIDAVADRIFPENAEA